MLKQFVVPVAYCIVTFTMIFVLFDLFDDLPKFREAQTPFGLICTYYGYMILTGLDYLLPASLLLGSLYALWQMARHHEVMAMRSSGLSLTRIMLPLLGAGFLLSLSMFAIKENISAHAAQWVAEFKERQRSDMPSFKIHRNVAFFNSIDRRDWVVGTFDEEYPYRFENVRILEERPDRTRMREWQVLRAEYLDGQWWFYGAQYRLFDEADQPVGGWIPPEQDINHIEQAPFTKESAKDFIISVRPWEYLSTREMLHYLQSHPRLSEKAREKYRYDVHARLAAPWACLVVILLGIPAGVNSGRRDALSGILTTLGLFFGFYALGQLGMVIGRSSTFPAWSGAWLTNIVFMSAGIYMLWKLR